jgi:hypothetical protein
MSLPLPPTTKNSTNNRQRSEASYLHPRSAYSYASAAYEPGTPGMREDTSCLRVVLMPCDPFVRKELGAQRKKLLKQTLNN